MIKNYFSLVLIGGLMLLAGCASKKEKAAEDKSYEALSQKATEALNIGKDELSIKALEQLVAHYSDKEDIPARKLLLADLYLKVGKFDQAYEMYRHYARLYPSDPQAEYAQYASIKARFYKTLNGSYDCDSKDAEHTIELCEEYLKQADLNKHRADIQDILNTCEARLVDKEVYVFNNYLRHGQYRSAENRLAYLKEKYVAKKPHELTPRVMYLECKLANEQRNRESVEQTFEKMIEQYPDSQFTRMAAGLIRSSGFIF